MADGPLTTLNHVLPAGLDATRIAQWKLRGGMSYAEWRADMAGSLIGLNNEMAAGWGDLYFIGTEQTLEYTNNEAAEDMPELTEMDIAEIDKGATIGHAKQRLRNARYVGITEPGIIAAEPPNPIVNHLVVLPDIEKRLEAFVRLGHGIIVFPGGAGTAEEILYLLGVLMDPANKDQYLPVVFTGPAESRAYFEQIDDFVIATLGKTARSRYRIIIDDPPEVARYMARSTRRVQSQRRKSGDAFYFNWLLKVPEEYQRPFEVTHESVANLKLHRDMPVHEMAANLRKVFSAVVTGNVKEHGIRRIRQFGPFEIRGDGAIMGLLDTLLSSFVTQGRMRLAQASYTPCYRVIPKN